eukprot:558302-Ditylum_brightwellii.AAC.1
MRDCTKSSMAPQASARTQSICDLKTKTTNTYPPCFSASSWSKFKNNIASGAGKPKSGPLH